MNKKLLKVSKISLFFFAAIATTFVNAKSYTTEVTLVRSWGGSNYSFQTTANNKCGANWWVFDVEKNKGYAILVNLAFTTGKKIIISDKDTPCGGGGTTSYASVGEFRIVK